MPACEDAAAAPDSPTAVVEFALRPRSGPPAVRAGGGRYEVEHMRNRQHDQQNLSGQCHGSRYRLGHQGVVLAELQLQVQNLSLGERESRRDGGYAERNGQAQKGKCAAFGSETVKANLAISGSGHMHTSTFIAAISRNSSSL